MATSDRKKTTRAKVQQILGKIVKKRPKQADSGRGVDNAGEESADPYRYNAEEEHCYNQEHHPYCGKQTALESAAGPSATHALGSTSEPPPFPSEATLLKLMPLRSRIPLPQIPAQGADSFGNSASQEYARSPPEQPRQTDSPARGEGKAGAGSGEKGPGGGSGEKGPGGGPRPRRAPRGSAAPLADSGTEVTQLVPLDPSRVSSHGDVVSPFDRVGLVVDPSLLPSKLRAQTEKGDEASGGRRNSTNTVEQQFRRVIQQLSDLQELHSMTIPSNETPGESAGEAARGAGVKRRSTVAGPGLQTGQDRLAPGAAEVERCQRVDQSPDTSRHDAPNTVLPVGNTHDAPNTVLPVGNTQEALESETNVYQNQASVDTDTETVTEDTERKGTSYAAYSSGTKSKDVQIANATYYDHCTTSESSPVSGNSDDVYQGSEDGVENHQSADSCGASDYVDSAQAQYGNVTASGRPTSFVQVEIQPEIYANDSPVDSRLGRAGTAACGHDTARQSGATPSDTPSDNPPTGPAGDHCQTYANAPVAGASDPDTPLGLGAATGDAAETRSLPDCTRNERYQNVERSEAGELLAAGNETVSSTVVATTRASRHSLSDLYAYVNVTPDVLCPASDAQERSDSHPMPLLDRLTRFFRKRRKPLSKKWK